MVAVLLLLGCAVVIYLACEWFVNGVEWLGARLRLGAVAVGTVLAAAGTALPESVVTLVAVLFGSEQTGDDIAVGAALGGPLVVGTVAYAVVGGMLLLAERRSPVARPAAGMVADPPVALADVDTTRLARDQAWFLVIFVGKVGLGLVAFAWKPWLAVLFVAAYVLYVRREMSPAGDRASSAGLDRLRLQPGRGEPALWAVLAQTVVSLVVVFGASQLFVRQLEEAAPALGLPAVVVALLLSPVATELPEVMNAVIWVRQRKTGLALANISGAMMIQATIPSALGIAFTPWLFDLPLLLAGIATLASVSYLRTLLRTGRVSARRLLAAGGFYLAFAVLLLADLLVRG